MPRLRLVPRLRLIPRLRLRAALALALLVTPLAAAPGGAQQPELYGPQPPAGSAFVRFVNATGGELSLRPDFLPAQTLGTQPVQRVTAYQVVERVAGRALNVEARAAGATARAALSANAGGFVTVLVTQGPGNTLTARAVTDGGDGNQTRARLAFYNAAPECPAAALGLEGGATIFADVAPSASKTRSVNPSAASLVAACGDRRGAAFPLSGLEAGGRYSIWMLPGATPAAFVTRDVVPGAWQPSR